MTNKLWVVMPAYNEEAAVDQVVKEWLPALRRHCPDFVFLALNDGSKDSTLAILNRIAVREQEFRVIDKPNSGHGQTCVLGYRLALKEEADWILQIDSDAQCDPVYLETFFGKTAKHKIVYGLRTSRDDGWKRICISRLVTFFAFAATGVWVKDCNVPYRLMHKSTVENIVDHIPKDFHLANVLLAVLQEKHFGIFWIPIHFRRRIGTPSVKTFSFVKFGIQLYRQLRAAARQGTDSMKNRPSAAVPLHRY
jgi:glycosyltransferase involved in cell wall biosynthesis